MTHVKHLTSILLLIFSSVNLLAQESKISEKSTQLKTYSFSDPDPVPEFGKIYPYFRFDGYEANGKIQDWKMIELENDYIKLWVTPEIGGKIWGAVEKSTGKEFIYYNHVVKFRNVAMRGPWTSGGIEINFGVIGHAPTSSSPVDYFIRKNDDGSVSCFVSAIDLAARTRWSVEVNLPKDKAYFTTRTTWDNPTDLEQSYYHWMNMGIKAAGNLEYIFPGNKYIGHAGDDHTWPVNEEGRQISLYDKNDFGGSKSYHVLGEATGFYGAYWHEDDFGFAHYSKYDEKPGKKIWIWGLSGQGMIWEKLLTDTDGQYSEIQSGRLFNQAEPRSSMTPFKNRGFSSGLTDEFTEYWFPVKQTMGMKNALPSGSVNLEQKDKMISLWFCPNEQIKSTLQVRKGKDVVFSRKIDSDPLQVFSASFEYEGNLKNLSVWLDNNLLYDPDRGKQLLKRPAESPSGFNWETVYGHYLKGKEFEQQRSYPEAEDEYLKAINADNWYVPALTGLSRLNYRKTDYNVAIDYALKALSVDTYDACANMMYGLSGLALGDTVSALDGFSIASQDISFRSAASNSLASLLIRKGDFKGALSYVEKSLSVNNLSSNAAQLKILCLRKLGLRNEADEELKKLEKNDPLNHFIRFEKYINDQSDENKSQVKRFITNELPQETYLEYAIWYFRNGQIKEALKILDLAPENHPVILLWQGYLNHLSGQEKVASASLSKALKQDAQFVFPFRKETLIPLDWAQSLSDDWKLKYYKGLIYLGVDATDKGRELLVSCGLEPEFYPFYFTRSALMDPTSNQAQADVNRALELSGDDWRAGWKAAKYYLSVEQTEKAEELAKKYYLKYPENYNLGLQYARILEINKSYVSCIDVLKKIQLLPSEGASESRKIWRDANLGCARNLMDSGKYKKALLYIEQAREWPDNLGVGKPYSPDERLEDSMALECYQKLNDKKSAKIISDKINLYKGTVEDH